MGGLVSGPSSGPGETLSNSHAAHGFGGFEHRHKRRAGDVIFRAPAMQVAAFTSEHLVREARQAAVREAVAEADDVARATRPGVRNRDPLARAALRAARGARSFVARESHLETGLGERGL